MGQSTRIIAHYTDVLKFHKRIFAKPNTHVFPGDSISLTLSKGFRKDFENL